MEIQIIFIIAILFIGSFIQGTSGFGFGLFSMGLLPIMLTLKDSTLLVMSLTLITSSLIVARVYKYIEWKGLLIILGMALIGRVFSFFVLNQYGNLHVMKQGLGLFLIFMVIFLLLNKDQTNSSIKLNPAFPVLLGFLGGFIGGVFAVGGPFFVFYYLMLYEEKHRYNANLQTTFVFTSLLTLLLHGFHGDFHGTLVLYFLLGAVSVFIGSTMGLKWFEKLPRDQIKKYASFIIFIAGLNLILFS
ncbi:sulfite exporter TauE/SafE family protein [Ammoniphilus sp. CFH 90114]|uniref:sulfite exporter TauE/SafE family protein n=1 Tax=Ammoniphilus sp. CFH 90114 TaxID=2493665 RepID=UPI00100F5601|nr:sulfite exporter TauE/SafE family protein [Ammoniphilus sp. CFH 90114]RXT06560.1 sulfite exporter TauE/SafE family protein [Ammoniphilus sp. CFH 90114]